MMVPARSTEPADPSASETVTAIYLAPATRVPMRSVDVATARRGGGLIGDRYEHARHRHVSVFSTGELDEASARLGSTIDPARTRRNVLVETGTLVRTPGHRLRIGEVELEVVRDAAPCRMLDEEVGVGARAAMRRRAGVICRVLEGGDIRVGDRMSESAAEPVSPPPEAGRSGS